MMALDNMIALGAHRLPAAEFITSRSVARVDYAPTV